MKRLIVLLTACILIVPVAIASDLSSMTIDELILLRNEIAAEIMSRPEWKEVTVPCGTWIVGQDIPAGVYCINMKKEGLYVSVKRPTSNGKTDLIVNQGINSQAEKVGRVELIDDDIVTVKYAEAVFSPAVSLGF